MTNSTASTPQRHRHHDACEIRLDELQAFDGAQHGDGRRDHAVAEEQRRARERAADEQLHAPPGTPLSCRCTSASSASTPPSPSLSARMMMTTYFSVTEIVSAQKMSDSTPRMLAASCEPAAFTDFSKAYSGLVPMSP